jgi:hypothetical protein
MKSKRRGALPEVYIDRFLYRGLWKLVQFGDGAVCLVPTRRFVSLVAIFGKVGYPADLLALHFRAAGSGAFAGNRSPYEIPAGMTASFNVISVERTLPVLSWLLGEGLLFAYEEDAPPIPSGVLGGLLSRARLRREEFEAWLEGSLGELPDWVDKWRGGAEAMSEWSWPEGAPSTCTVLHSALSRRAYPAMFSTRASVWWCERLRYELAPLADVEARLCDMLPDRLLGFPDLLQLASHPAARAMREHLTGLLSRGGEPHEAPLTPVVEVVGGLGSNYLDAVCGSADSSRYVVPFGPFPECRPSATALEYLGGTSRHVEHRAGFALAHADGLSPELRLLHEYSCELWLNHLTQHDVQQALAGDAPWGKSSAARTLRPF